MNYLGIDYLIVYAFLAISLFIGLRAGRGIKDMREYAIGNRMFGTGALVLTYLATNITGAGVLHSTGIVFSKGIIVTFAGLGVVIAFLIRAFFIAPKVARFTDCLTMGDLMKEFYGSYSGIIAGILGFLTAISIAGMDLLGISIVCESLLGIKASWCIVVCGLLLAIYSAHGGIKSVTATDVFQFLVLIVVFPTIAYIVLEKAGGIQAVFTQVPVDRLKVFSHENFSFYLTLFLIWSIFPAGMIDPAIIQRLLMAKDGRQIRNQYLIIAGFQPAFQLMIVFIAFSALVLYPQLEGRQVLPHIIETLLPVGMKGFAIAGLLATSISSIDSYLHAAGLTFIHDVIKPITEKRYTFNELRWTRYATIGVSLVAITIALNTTDTFGLLLSTLAFTGPLLMFPLLSGIMGLKTDKRSFYIALVATLIAFAYCKFFLPPSQAYLTTLISILANGVVFFGMHIIQNKGFAIVNRSHGAEHIWQPSKNNTKSFFKSLIPSPSAIIHYSQEKVKKYRAPYVLFGVFFTINYIAPYFIWPTKPLQYSELVIAMRIVGGVLCGLLIVQDKWPQWVLPYMPTYWHITVLYCLPFTSTMMFLLTEASTEWLVNIMSIIILLVVLLDWVTAIIIGILGIGLALIGYHLFINTSPITLDFTAQYLLIYQIVFGLLIGLLFARRKQQHFDQLATDHQSLSATHQEDRATLLETFKEKVRLLKTLKHAGIQDLSKAVKLIRAIRTEGQQALQASQPLNHLFQQLDNTVTPIAVALERIENRATDYLRLDIKPITIDTFLEKVQEQLSNQHLSFKLYTQHQQLVCDPARMQKILINTINTLKANIGHDVDIYISLYDTALTYPIHSLGKDYIKQIAAIGFSITANPIGTSLQESYEAQMSGIYLPISETVQELLLTINHRITKAHYGYTNVNISQQTDYETYLYIIPVDVNEVRPRDMNDPYMELGAELVRANDTYPGAAEQEASFLAAVQQKTSAHIETIQTALETIKWYHGAKNRHSGEPFYLHPLAVAQIVLDWSPDEATILGALLHDTVEDTAMLLENIDMMFGPEVVTIVDGVTHFESTQESFYKIKLSNHENILMLLEIEDKRALQVKIADRIHNMRTINGHQSHTKKQKIAEETLQFFVPLAKALGLDQAAKELKEMSVPLLNELTQKK